MADSRSVVAARESAPACRQPEISDAVIAGAESIISRLSAEFPGYAARDLRRLEREAAFMADNDDATESHYSEIFRIAHDILGQGAVFGYPLLSRMAGTLCLALRTLGPRDDAIVAIVHSHIAGMRALVDYRVTGTGNQSALTIALALEVLVNSRSRG